jgi:hypothetical protein
MEELKNSKKMKSKNRRKNDSKTLFMRLGARNTYSCSPYGLH